MCTRTELPDREDLQAFRDRIELTKKVEPIRRDEGRRARIELTLAGEQDMNRMGGLRRKLPITFWTMMIATLAIAAVPPFSGYFSKDLILEAAYESGHYWLWILGVITAGLTSFYMFRLIFMTFFGDSRVEANKEHHIHESPATMTIPLIVLAILATVGGWVGMPNGLVWGNAFVRLLESAVGDL